MPSLRGIIFDLDGVLIESREWHALAFVEALKKFGFSISLAEHQLHLNGLPTVTKMELLTRLFGFTLDETTHQKVVKEKQRLTQIYMQEYCRPSPQITQVLEWVRGAGYKLGLCTNSIRSTMDTTLAGMGLTHHFDIRLCNQDVLRPKPDPEIYIRAMQSLDLSPSNCIIIEDSPFGIEAAIQSGAHVEVVHGVADVHLRWMQGVQEKYAFVEQQLG